MNLVLDIQKKYSDFQLNISASFENGIHCVFGPSGCGKTTLLNCISGITIPDAGTISFNEKTLFSNAQNINIPIHHRHIGYIFQKLYLFDHLTVVQNLQYSRSHSKCSIEEISETLNIKDILYHYPHEISYGQAQRTAIGRAILSDPQLLIMDEPMSSLDFQNRLRILAYIKKIYNEFSIPVIYVSHNIDEIEYLNTNITVLDNGAVKTSGTVPEILEKHSDVLPQPFINNHVSIIPGVIKDITADHAIAAVSNSKQLKLRKGSFAVHQNVTLIIRAVDVKCATSHLPDMNIENIYCGHVETVSIINKSVIIKINAGFSIYSKMSFREFQRMNIQKDTAIHFFFSPDSIRVYSE